MEHEQFFTTMQHWLKTRLYTDFTPDVAIAVAIKMVNIAEAPTDFNIIT
jgi:hypothetical protein